MGKRAPYDLRWENELWKHGLDKGGGISARIVKISVRAGYSDPGNREIPDGGDLPYNI